MLSTAQRCYVRRNRLCLISSVGYHSINDYYQLLLMLNGVGDKSFVDDLVASRYCKCESSLCCYEALRFILRFYDLFFLVSKNWLFGFPGKSVGPSDKMVSPSDKMRRKIFDPSDKMVSPSDKMASPSDKMASPSDKMASLTP